MYTDIEGYKELRGSETQEYVRGMQRDKGLQLSGSLFGFMASSHGWDKIQSVCIAHNEFSIFFHSTTRPAVIYKSGLVCWFFDGNPHRELFPADIWPSGSCSYYNHGKGLEFRASNGNT
jgi:hypothetical protein